MTRRFLLAIALAAVPLAAATAPAAGDVSGVVTIGAKPVADAVVWLDAPEAPRRPLEHEVVLEQRGMAFSPHVLAVQVQTPVRFPNDDRVYHNVFSQHDGKTFDLGMYPVGASRQVIFDRAGLSRIFCNIHPQMAAYVMAVDTPYFAVSDKAGHFTIAAVPAGRYPSHAWRPGADVLDLAVQAGDGRLVQVHWK